MDAKLDLIHDYLTKDILNDPELKLGYDQDLLLSGILDSISTMKLVAWLETTNMVTIPPEDIIIENFGSLDQIGSYLNTFKN